MKRAFPLVSLALLAVLLSLAGGCSTTISTTDFISKYTTNIDVPNPDEGVLPTRTFLGKRGRKTEYYVLTDSIPRQQGGGLLGKGIRWRCPAAELPTDFPQAYRPGDVILDGRKGAAHNYLIQSYRPATRPAGTDTRPAGAVKK